MNQFITVENPATQPLPPPPPSKYPAPTSRLVTTSIHGGNSSNRRLNGDRRVCGPTIRRKKCAMKSEQSSPEEITGSGFEEFSFGCNFFLGGGWGCHTEYNDRNRRTPVEHRGKTRHAAAAVCAASGETPFAGVIEIPTSCPFIMFQSLDTETFVV